MSFSAIAHDLIFKTSQDSPWEKYPYTSSFGIGEINFFEYPEHCHCNKSIPNFYLRLNIRKKLNELYPKNYPNIDTVGHAVFELLQQNGINHFYTAEVGDEVVGDEFSNHWFGLEAVYISPSDYEKNVLTKIDNTVVKVIFKKDGLSP